MAYIRKYALASLTGLAFATFLPMAFAFLYASSMNMVHGFSQRGQAKVEIGVVDSLVHLMREMPHLWFLAIIPGMVGFRVGLKMSRRGLNDRTSVKMARRRRYS